MNFDDDQRDESIFLREKWSKRGPKNKDSSVKGSRSNGQSVVKLFFSISRPFFF